MHRTGQDPAPWMSFAASGAGCVTPGWGGRFPWLARASVSRSDQADPGATPGPCPRGAAFHHLIELRPRGRRAGGGVGEQSLHLKRFWAFNPGPDGPFPEGHGCGSTAQGDAVRLGYTQPDETPANGLCLREACRAVG